MSGLRMPAEWEPHDATWIAWPHETSDWPGKFRAIVILYGEIVRILSQHETVAVLVGLGSREKAKEVCQRAGARMSWVQFFPAKTDRSWTRDYCPTFVHNSSGGLEAVKWMFNGWAKYNNHKLDNLAGERVARRARAYIHKPLIAGYPIVLEGGSIDVNGTGTLLTTEECLLSPVQARNPNVSREQLEVLMSEYLGIDRVIWLKRGITGDDTHGHIDDLARFVSPDTTVISVESDPTDENYLPLRENLRLLKKAVKKVVELPMPRPVLYKRQRLPASYANFYIANGVVLVPTFHDPSDRIALNIIAKLFPDREVIGIHAVDLVLGLGTLHCMTMQQPAPQKTV